jgi:hypothetical protein
LGIGSIRIGCDDTGDSHNRRKTNGNPTIDCFLIQAEYQDMQTIGQPVT